MFEYSDTYAKQVDVLSESDGYLDDAGIWHSGTKSILKTIDCDIQPYSKERAYEDYGFTVECSKRMFCDVDIALQVGVTVVYNNEQYIIQKIADWDDYYDVMLNNQ